MQNEISNVAGDQRKSNTSLLVWYLDSDGRWELASELDIPEEATQVRLHWRQHLEYLKK